MANPIMHHATELPLHGGRAPRWLFGRMVRLSRAISEVILDDFGADELVIRLSDPDWFQALACAIGYDWHSSGTTTVTIGALREALNGSNEVYVAGGKGKAGLNTPFDIEKGTELLSISKNADALKETSRLAAKVDSALVYDDLGIYQHSMIFSKRKWSVVQQGMAREGGMAVRFQWLSDSVDKGDIANEPHSGMRSNRHYTSMDLTDSRNSWARKSSIEVLEEYRKMLSGRSYPSRHPIIKSIDMGKRAADAIGRARELDPKDYKELMLVKGIGRATLRSLAFVSSLIYDRELACRDPVMFAYNLGGKDGIPFRVDRGTYDDVCGSLEGIIENARIESGEKYGALKRLSREISGHPASDFIS